MLVGCGFVDANEKVDSDVGRLKREGDMIAGDEEDHIWTMALLG